MGHKSQKPEMSLGEAARRLGESFMRTLSWEVKQATEAIEQCEKCPLRHKRNARACSRRKCDAKQKVREVLATANLEIALLEGFLGE